MKKLTLAALILLAGALSAVEIPLRNPEFKTDDKGAIPFWTAIEPKDRSGNFQSVPFDAEKGICALKISSAEGIRYYGVCQGGFDLKKFPRPGAGEALQITMRFRQKNENVANGGFVNFSFFSKKGYLIGRDTKMIPGTFDWGDIEASTVFPEFPKDAAFFQVRFFLGKSTGTVWFAEPKLYMNVIPKK